MKRFYKIFIKIIFIFVILIPEIKVNAVNCTAASDECEVSTQTFDHYYFFLLPVSDKQLPYSGSYESTVVESTFYKEPDSSVSKLSEIKLNRNCKSDPDCFNMIEFYKLFEETKEHGEVVTFGNDQAKYYEIGNKKYYTHGSWRNEGGKWKNNVFEKMYGSGNDIQFEASSSNQVSCASVEGKYLTTSITKIEDNPSSNYFKINISRKINNISDLNIRTIYANTLQGNISNCTGVYAVKEYKFDGGVLFEKAYLLPAYATYQTTRNRYNCKPKSNSATSSCDSSSEIKTSCNKLTIETTDDNVTDIQIDNKTTVSNSLEPKKIYQGGGITFSAYIYSETSWDYNGRINADDNTIKKRLKEELKSVNDFKEEIQREAIIKINGAVVADINNNLVVECSRNGELNRGEKVITQCKITLGTPVITPYTGTVTYLKKIGDGVNNKYYLDLAYSGNLSVSADLGGLNVYKESNYTGFKNWTMTIANKNTRDKSCSIEVENRLYDDGGGKSLDYKFIYRPIDVNNPFPNRNAGVNWYYWYQKRSHQERLSESYNNNKLQYSITLTPSKISEITSNYNDNYLDWSGINAKEESKFVSKEFNSKDIRNNILEDDS